MEQKKEERLLLLQLIEKNGSLDDILDLGYEYYQITTFIKAEINAGFAHFDKGQIFLTPEGIDEKKALLKFLKIKDSGKFVQPRLSAKDVISQLGINEIFVPLEDELPF